MKRELIVFKYQNESSKIKNIIFNFSATLIETFQNLTLNKHGQQCNDLFKDDDVSVIMEHSDAGRIELADVIFNFEERLYACLRSEIPHGDCIPVDDVLSIIKILDPIWPFIYASYNMPPNRDNILQIYTKINEAFLEEYRAAHVAGKHLLVLVGECHAFKDSFLISLLALKAAASIGINNYLIEWPSVDTPFERFSGYNATADQAQVLDTLLKPLEFAKYKLNMDIVAVDPKHDAEDEDSAERDAAMTDAVAAQVKSKDAIYVVGAYHASHIASSPEIQESANVFMLFPERMLEMPLVACEVINTIGKAGEHYLVANINGNPFYLTTEQIYDLVVG